MAFASDDYRDVMHVKPEAGTRFVGKLISDLETMNGK